MQNKAVLIKYESQYCSLSTSPLKPFQKQILVTAIIHIFATSWLLYYFLFQNGVRTETKQLAECHPVTTGPVQHSTFLYHNNTIALFLYFLWACNTYFKNICLSTP